MFTESVIQFLKFAAVGGVNTFIDWAVYFTVLKMFPAESIIFYSLAKGFSYFCGMLNSFFLNRCWTFKAGPEEHEGSRFIRFVVVNALGLGINSVFIFIFLNLNLNHALALFFTTGITFGFNFTLSKLWVFRKDKMVAKTTGG